MYLLFYFHSSLCIHCSLLACLHDVQDVSTQLYTDGFFTDDTFTKLQPSSQLSRQHKITLLLEALAMGEKRETSASNITAIESLSNALTKKYPNIAALLPGTSAKEINVCQCPEYVQTPCLLDNGIDAFRILFDIAMSQSPDVPIGHAEGGPELLQANNVKLCIDLDAIICSGDMKSYETHVDQLLQVWYIQIHLERDSNVTFFDMLRTDTKLSDL